MLQHRMNVKNIAFAGTIVGSVLVNFAGLSALVKAVAYPLNPCPRIYYEEPFNSTRIVPQGCPPNAATQQLNRGEIQTPQARPNRTMPYGTSAPIQPPLPETQTNAIAAVNLTDGLFDVRVTNNTNTLISYEVIGHTQRRYLQGGEAAYLQGIPAPATITFVRQDDGFVEVIPISTAEPGLLSISLDEDLNPSDSSAGALRIQDDGRVYLN